MRGHLPERKQQYVLVRGKAALSAFVKSRDAALNYARVGGALTSECGTLTVSSPVSVNCTVSVKSHLMFKKLTYHNSLTFSGAPRETHL